MGKASPPPTPALLILISQGGSVRRERVLKVALVGSRFGADRS